MTALRAVLAIFLGDVRRHPGNAIASALAMVAGVAVFVGIHQAGSAARSSFVSSVEAIAGRATHQVVSESGVAERRLVPLLGLDAVRDAQPVVEGMVAVVSIGSGDGKRDSSASPLRLLGIDPFLSTPFLGERGGGPVIDADDFDAFLTRPGTVIIPGPWAAESGARVGDRIMVSSAGRLHELKVLAIYDLDVLGEAARDTAVVDIATAQETLDRVGLLDRIDLIIEKSGGGEAAVAAALRDGERLERPSSRGQRVAKMIDAFRLNLLALGSLALVVGSLLVYNAAQFSVVRRGGLLGQLRCLGVSRGLVILAVLAEVALLGLTGGILGVLAGTLLARQLATTMGRTITDLYAFVRVELDPLGVGFVALVIAGAVAVAVAAGVFPALDAARTAPRMVGVRSRSELQFRRQLPRLLAFSAGGAIVGLIAMNVDVGGWWMGFVASLAFLVAGATLLPPLMALALPVLRRIGERAGWMTLPVAAGAIERSLTRTGGAAAALGVALSMTLGVIVMIGSFEREVRRWIESTLLADVFVADASESVTRQPGRIPAEAVAEMRALPGVRAVDTLRGVELPYADRSIFFTGAELPVEESRLRFEFIEGERDTAVDLVERGAVIISEPLSNRYGLGVGDELVVDGRRGEERFEIAGVFRDFSFDRGYAVTSSERFIAAFDDPGVKNVALYLEEPGRSQEFAAALRARLSGRFLLEVRSNAELRTRILAIFHRTFEVTYALQTIATVMALAGIAVTLVGLFIERSREIATVRAIGSSIAAVGRLFGVESILMALFPIIIALPLGALLALILITIVNFRSFGWTIDMAWPWSSVLLTCALAALAGLLASAAPLWLVRRQSIARALREE